MEKVSDLLLCRISVNIEVWIFLYCIKFTRILVFSNSYFLVKGQNLQYCSYMGKHGSEKTRILAYFTQCFVKYHKYNSKKYTGIVKMEPVYQQIHLKLSSCKNFESLMETLDKMQYSVMIKHFFRCRTAAATPDLQSSLSEICNICGGNGYAFGVFFSQKVSEILSILYWIFLGSQCFFYCDFQHSESRFVL